MIFASPLFLFGFLPAFLGLYLLTPARFRNVVALLASLLFYAWGEPVFVFIAFGSTLFDFVLARALSATARPALRRLLVALGVASNLSLLFYFKYANFAAVSASWLGQHLFGAALPALGAIALPIGVSFIVFEKITYIVDVYRGSGKPTRSLHDYLLYVFLFPKLLAGPIIKYHDIEEQLRERRATFDDRVQGLTRFAFGLAKKVLLADPMGELSDAVFNAGPAPIGFKLAWLGTLAFSLQIFFDFSGYSDIAIGIARTMGFRLMENFKRPYLAVGFGDFWRRWHISLSTWIRDYLYIPLGGERVPPARLYLNLWICFLASGLWHGAAWTFVIWGAYHGLFLTLDRLFLGRWLRNLPRAVAVAFTFLAVTVGWIFFRAPTFSGALAHIGTMLDPGRESLRMVVLTRDVYLTMAVAFAICFLPPISEWKRAGSATALTANSSPLTTVAACVALIVSVAKVTTVAFHPFLYFRF